MKSHYDALMEDAEFRRLMAIETLAAETAELIARLMAEQGMSKAALARRLGKSRAWVTQLLSGKANMTLRTLAEVAHALGVEVTLRTPRPDRKRTATSAPSVHIARAAKRVRT